MYNAWIWFLIVFNGITLFACSEARAQGLVDARRPFESAPRSTSAISAERQLELQVKLEEARARASQFPSPLPLAGALGSYGYQVSPCIGGAWYPAMANCYRTYQLLQIGDRLFLQEGVDVTTRREIQR